MRRKPVPVLETDVHHRLPRASGGKGINGNKVVVLKSQHVHYHALFADKTPHQIAKILSETWIDKRFVLVALPRTKKDDYSGEGVA